MVQVETRQARDPAVGYVFPCQPPPSWLQSCWEVGSKQSPASSRLASGSLNFLPPCTPTAVVNLEMAGFAPLALEQLIPWSLWKALIESQFSALGLQSKAVLYSRSNCFPLEKQLLCCY